MYRVFGVWWHPGLMDLQGSSTAPRSQGGGTASGGRGGSDLTRPAPQSFEAHSYFASVKGMLFRLEFRVTFGSLIFQK